MVEPLPGQSEINELNFRRAFCREVIHTLSGMDDPRKDDALQEYQRQIAEIDKKIEALTGKPPDVTVGLQTARLFGKSEMK
jgi:hypothetical protein